MVIPSPRIRVITALVPAVLLTSGPLSAQEPERAAGTIVGRVLESDGRRGIGQVDLYLVEAGRRTTTNSRGEFRFEGVVPGQHRLRVRHLGYRSRELTLRVPASEILGLTIRLDPEPVALDPLGVEVESELRLRRLEDRGFYHRRALDFGHFFGPQYLTRWSGLRLPNLVGRTPGVVVRRKGPGREFEVYTRRCLLRGRPMSVIVDGLPWRGPPDFPVTDIAAIEVYKGPSQTVGTLNQGGGCGLLLIWTWHGPNPFHELVTEGYSCPERIRRFRIHAC